MLTSILVVIFTVSLSYGQSTDNTVTTCLFGDDVIIRLTAKIEQLQEQIAAISSAVIPQNTETNGEYKSCRKS